MLIHTAALHLLELSWRFLLRLGERRRRMKALQKSVCQKSILNFHWAFMNYCSPVDFFWLLFIGHSDME